MGYKITEKYGVVQREFVKGNLVKLKNFSSYVSTKQVAYDLEELFRANCNPYIPVNQGNIRDHGYKVTLSNSKTKPWYRLTYRNTSKLPYVMYQYMGHIWKPASPLFEQTAESFNPNVLKLRDVRIKYKHIGWFVRPGANYHETEIKFRRHPVNIKQKIGKNKYRTIHITGYTNNKNAQPKWVEYARKHTGWMTGSRVYVESVYSSVLNQIVADEQKREQRNEARRAARAYKKALGDIAKVLGYNPSKPIRTRLRKKKQNLGG